MKPYVWKLCAFIFHLGDNFALSTDIMVKEHFFKKKSYTGKTYNEIYVYMLARDYSQKVVSEQTDKVVFGK